MQSGRLDRMISMQRNVGPLGEDGTPTEVWSLVGPLRRPASMKPVRGDERFTDPQYNAVEQIEFRVRYSEAVASLNPLDRIIYPALAPDDWVLFGAVLDLDFVNGLYYDQYGTWEVETRQIHDILAVHEIGRREGLQIITSRRADVTTS